MKRVIFDVLMLTTAVATVGQTVPPSLPTEPGMYVEASDGITKIIGQIAEFKRTGSTLASRATVGIKSVKENIQLLGPHAQAAVSPQPTFYFLPAKQEADAGVNAGDLILVRLEEKPERRQFEIAARGLGRASSGISLTHQVRLFRSEVSTGVYKVSPAMSLSKGEYALYLSRGEGMAPYVYDFGVQQIASPVVKPKPSAPTSSQNAPRVPPVSPALSAADFSSKPHANLPPPQVFKGATIGVFCDGSPDVRHDGVSLTALTPGGPADQAGIRAGDSILAVDDHFLFTIRELQEEITHHQPGTTIAVRYRRYSTIYQTQVIVGQVQ